MRRVTWWLAVAAIVALSLPIGARLTGLEPGPLALVVSFMPWITLACLVPLVLAACIRAWVLVGISGALLALCVWFAAPLFVNGGGGGEPAITIATVNVQFGLADAEQIVTLVEEQDVDVLSVQELTPDAVSRLSEAGLDELLPFSAVLAEPGITGTGMWTNLPLSDPYELQGYLSHQVVATIDGPQGEFTMLAVHPIAPGRYNHEDWAREMALMRNQLADIDGQVIVAGDFNTTRDHKVFRDILALGYEDAAERIDAGFVPTFPANRELFPLLAIDHVLTREALLRPATFSAFEIDGADHLALVVGYAASGGT